MKTVQRGRGFISPPLYLKSEDETNSKIIP